MSLKSPQSAIHFAFIDRVPEPRLPQHLAYFHCIG